MNNPGIIYAFALAASALLLSSCSPRMGLQTLGAQESDVEGSFAVIYYGCNFLNDFETIAFLDREGDGYTFEPYAPEFNYRLVRGLAAKEALAKAEHFLQCNTGFSHVRIMKIVAPGGKVVGYELQPVYQPFVYGGGEALFTDYRLQDGRVIISIQPAAWVERMLSGGRGRGRED